MSLWATGKHFAVGKRLKGWQRALWIVFLWGGMGMLGFVILCNVWVVASTHRFIFKDVESAGWNEVALVLGTSKNVSPGRANQHFVNRIERAADLYQAQRVKRLLVSGDFSSRYYNEPQDMQDALEIEGIPSGAITRDAAGFRTLDSIIRAHEIFQLDRFTVVSDGFHLPRAVFIARAHGMEVSGVASDRVSLRTSFKTEIRECFARVKAVLDVYVLDTEPQSSELKTPIALQEEGL